MILGIDIGGTSVKFGLVSKEGKITTRRTFLTNDWVTSVGFVNGLKSEIGNYLKEFPEIESVGLGFPGILAKDRSGVIWLQNIPSIQNFPLIPFLSKEFPNIKIKLENDSNCAALGEYIFGENKGMDNFILIALGTGIGSGCIINHRLFIGARGNGMEFGDMLTDGKQTLEKQIGLNQIIAYAIELIQQNPSRSTLLKPDDITPKTIYEAAVHGDELAISIYNYVGKLLGESLVSAIRILDITNILLGGGVSGAFEFIEPALRKVLVKHLHPYYIEELSIKKASLSNDAGILGAASLMM